MRNLFRKFVLAAFLTAFGFTGVVALSPPAYASAGCDGGSFLGLPTWHKYLEKKEEATGVCTIVIDFEGNPNTVWLVGAAIIEILLRVGGILIFIWCLKLVLAAYKQRKP